MERWKVTRKDFEDALGRYPTDDRSTPGFASGSPPHDVQSANDWLPKERT